MSKRAFDKIAAGLRDVIEGRVSRTTIIVACKCGWHGPQSELVARPASQSVIVGEKLCPECSAVFSPARRPNP